MNISWITSEAVPYAKTGGLADVVGSLPKEIDRKYYDVRVIIPKYACMKQEMKDKLEYVTNFYMDFHWKNEYVGILEAEVEGVKYYFIDNEMMFGASGASSPTSRPRAASPTCTPPASSPSRPPKKSGPTGAA